MDNLYQAVIKAIMHHRDTVPTILQYIQLAYPAFNDITGKDINDVIRQLEEDYTVVNGVSSGPEVSYGINTVNKTLHIFSPKTIEESQEYLSITDDTLIELCGNTRTDLLTNHAIRLPEKMPAEIIAFINLIGHKKYNDGYIDARDIFRGYR